MNPLHANLTTHRQARRNRAGLSIIEVLTSIVVAMIGVFGVMILIPFAVKQAKTGLDSDAAVALARNAISQFEIAGYRAPSNWAVYRGTNNPQVTAYSPFADTDRDNDGTVDGPDFPEVFSIDPLGITENGGATTQLLYANAIFPFNRRAAGMPPTPYPNNLLISPANLGTPTGVVMGTSLARRMFRSADDLVFGEAADELLGPEQVFDQGAPGFLRRQAVGRLSWSAIVVPFKDDPLLVDTTRWAYKMYILVYKDRATSFDPIVANRDPNEQMSTALVTNTGSQSPVSNVFLETSVTSVQGVVNRDDWVMLINQSPAAEKGFDRQIAFYRVVSTADANGANPTSITLDGPDFVFLDDTFIVHLKNVLGVYERTFQPESESNWNVSF